MNNDKPKTELLAPAKDKTTAFAAIDCGADAIYIGPPSFGARKNASNSLDDIKEVVSYAHKFWVKVFVTVNTILKDNELEDAVQLLLQLDKIGVDAVIIQDMGLLKRIIDLQNNNDFSMPIHISTQCDNRNNEKISFFNNIGVTRVVLARELSLDQIHKIHKENPYLELEAFVHGALCVSYSGQCYLSQYIGGRSANRGECAQPCRKKYSIINDKGMLLAKDIHALCLKDFNSSKHIKSMIENGIYSFKIEGRLKETGYVKNITAFYRQELDKYSEKSSSGKSVFPFNPNPEKSFNRGFTDYFLKERTDCFNFKSPKSKGEYIGTVKDVFSGYFTINTKKTLHSQDGLCFYKDNNLDGFLINKIINNKIFPNRNITLKPGQKIYRNSDSEFEKQLSMPVKRQIACDITFNQNKIILEDEDGIKIELDIKSNEIANDIKKMNSNFIKQFQKTGESDFYIREINIYSNLPFLKVSQINEIRRQTFKLLMDKRIKSYKRIQQKKIKYEDYFINKVDYRANVHNNDAAEFYNKCKCTVTEQSYETVQPKRQIELMRTKHCIKYALKMCKSGDKLTLEDDRGTKYPLQFDCKNCEMVILSPEQSD